MTMQFSAPWSSKLVWTTWLATGLLVALSFVDAIAAVLCLSILIGSAALSVRGYSILDGELLVHRIGWATRISLRDVRHAEVDPEAMRGSIRTFGNGGLFAFVGRFRNKALGPYRAFVTDADRSVVLEFGDETVVVTPDRPEAFAAAVMAAR